MPDHVHLLAQGQRQDSDVRRFQSAAKQYSGYYYKLTFGETLWQRYGYERVLRENEDTVQMVRYLIANPLRAGMVRNLREYPFWGSGICSMDELMDAVQAETTT